MRKLIWLWLLVPGLAAAATPSEGVELKIRRGFFTETDLGAFFTVGGRDAYSNAQSYLQLGIGYDLGQHFELGLQLGLGASNANCFATGSAVDGTCTQADNFTMTFVDLSAAYLVPLHGRLYLTPKLLAGYTHLDPAPVAASGKTAIQAANVGAGLGVEYATSFDHFSVGADVTFRYVFTANVPAFAIFPRVKYTF